MAVEDPEAPIEGPRLKIAAALSLVINPLYVALPASLAVCLKVSTGTGAAFFWWLLYVTFSSVIPLIDLLVRLKLGKVSDFHVTDRKERTPPMLLNIVSISAGTILMWLLGAPDEIVAMVFAGLLMVIVTLFVNLWWKISLHAIGMFQIYAILLLVFRTWTFFLYNSYMLVVLAAVCWSRVVLKKHTTAQVLAGAFVGAVLPVLSFWALGLIG